MVPGVGINPLLLGEKVHLFVCLLIDFFINLLRLLLIVRHHTKSGVFGESMPFLPVSV